MDTCNVDTSNMMYNKCCILQDNICLKNTISLQSQEIGKLITERDEYKSLCEKLLLEFGNMSYISSNM